MNTSETPTNVEERETARRSRAGERYTLAVTHDRPTATSRPHICGLVHRLEAYERGCGYGTYIVGAIEASWEEDHNTASRQASLADYALLPLGDVGEPDSLRDFIAGAHHAFETHLRAMGTPVRGG